MNTKYKKMKGNAGEELVANYYQDHGYILIERKYTIKGGELDLIFQKNNILTFVEVKVVDHIDDLQDYVTPKKLGHVKHTINFYLLTHPTDKEYVLDVVFVRDNSILQIYQNVTNT
ncbi:MAG: YraN family protein [Candidatus Absconditabacterales bacterium]